MNEEKTCINTDVELWREVEGDYYSPSIHRTEGGGIGINVGGHVIVKTLREWHKLATISEEIKQNYLDKVKPLIEEATKDYLYQSKDEFGDITTEGN